MNGKYNTRSPAVKRIMREAAELSEPAADYFAAPLEDNLFEWHFTVRGPDDTEFQGGVYHGRIILPPDYPMKPPDIVLLTPNGRFEVGKKICLSISGYHPETWQPSWSIRTALLAIIGFMPTPAKSYEVGAVSYTPEERKKLATRSQNWICSTCDLKPSSLLANASQGSKVSEEEVQDIVKTLQLKGSENSDSISPSADANTSSSQSEAASANCSSKKDTSSSPTTLEDLTMNSGNNNPSENRTIQETREPENAGFFFGLQTTDFMIAILVIGLAFLLYRRFSDQVFLLENGETSDFSEM